MGGHRGERVTRLRERHVRPFAARLGMGQASLRGRDPGETLMVLWIWLGPVLLGTLPDPRMPGAPPATSLRGEVLDADTGRPIPCRVSIRGEDGTWYFPAAASPQGSAVPYQR